MGAGPSGRPSHGRAGPAGSVPQHARADSPRASARHRPRRRARTLDPTRHASNSWMPSATSSLMRLRRSPSWWSWKTCMSRTCRPSASRVPGGNGSASALAHRRHVSRGRACAAPAGPQLARTVQQGERLSLEPFTERDVVSFLEATGDQADPHLVRELHRRPMGIRFFSRRWRGSGARRARRRGRRSRDRSAPRFRSAGRGDPGLPSLLRRGAIVGREFDIGLLEACYEDDAGDYVEGCQEGTDAAILVEIAPQRYRFVHFLIRQLVYDAIPEDDRLGAHARLAQILECRPRTANHAGRKSRTIWSQRIAVRKRSRPIGKPAPRRFGNWRSTKRSSLPGRPPSRRHSRRHRHEDPYRALARARSCADTGGRGGRGQEDLRGGRGAGEDAGRRATSGARCTRARDRSDLRARGL